MIEMLDSLFQKGSVDALFDVSIHPLAPCYVHRMRKEKSIRLLAYKVRNHSFAHKRQTSVLPSKNKQFVCNCLAWRDDELREFAKSIV